MTLTEKILAYHAVGSTGGTRTTKPGDMLCVKVQWTLACEVTWKSMEQTYEAIGRPRIWRSDRFWLAVDHTVDPRINHQARTKAMIDASEGFAHEAGIVHYQPPNTTILHTEFYRQHVLPGQIVVGADSHSCSTGAMGAFAIGLGAADVVMPLVTGETWIQVPETVRVTFVGAPPFGSTGKDVMLATLGQLRCNAVAIGRAVEYAGNIEALSCDKRFAISNMTAEFGGIAGIFPADHVTAAYIARRESASDGSSGSSGSPLYFRADENAQYVATHEIHLDDLAPQVALSPSPDNVVDVTQVAGTPLDGCFIGACTTTEEELILAGLVLQAGLAEGLVPKGRSTATGTNKRRVTPGSLRLVDRLRRLGLLQAYRDAGFDVGAPGCSYCLAIAADVAGEGEVWLSSQNRNYRNRMGKGSIAHLASAATVAASSFDMEITDPRSLVAKIDRETYARMTSSAVAGAPDAPLPSLVPPPLASPSPSSPNGKVGLFSPSSPPSSPPPSSKLANIQGKVQIFGDHIDTDAILPGEFLTENDVHALGKVAFLHTNPDFRDKVRQSGQTIVVAGHGFGCGSSREQAVTALKGAGVRAVIAKSFGYIFSRNVQNFSLVGIPLADDRFYARVTENSLVNIDMEARTIIVDEREIFRFDMSLLEERLLAGGGIVPLYRKYGKKIFRIAMAKEKDGEGEGRDGSEKCGGEGSGCSEAAVSVEMSW